MYFVLYNLWFPTSNMFLFNPKVPEQWVNAAPCLMNVPFAANT